jgi:hypothetical protein
MARLGWPGVFKQIGIRAVRCSSVTFLGLLMDGDITNWYQSQGTSTEPGWAG